MNWKAILQAVTAAAIQGAASGAQAHVGDPEKTSWKDLGKSAGVNAGVSALSVLLLALSAPKPATVQ
jgi:tartrate dehydratase beta subunit/fumarate hydratase class I family protein